MKVLVAVVASACLVAALGGCTSSKTVAKDVTITACKPSPSGGHPTATGKVLNHSSKASVYTIHIKFKDTAGNSVGDGVTALAKVESGASAIWHATGSLSAKGPVKCTLASATRTVSP